MDTLSLVLIGVGIAFILAELVLPGGIVVWLGVSSLALVGLRIGGWVTEVSDMFVTWCGISVGLVVFSVVFLQKYFRGEVEKKHFDDVEVALGEEVTVEKTVVSEDNSGRVTYQGTSWKAQTEGAPLQPGETAVIIGRENITWIVSGHTESKEG